jgi:AraC-like DNA-binding protein
LTSDCTRRFTSAVPDRTETTVSTRYIRTVVEAAADRGTDPERLLRGTGIAPGGLDALERIPSSTVRRIWDRAIDSTGDRRFGLQVGGRLRPGAYHVLGHALLASPTLQDAAQLTVRYHHLVSNAGRLSFTRHADRAVLTYRRLTPPGDTDAQQTEAVFAGILTAARWLSPDGWQAARITFIHPGPDGTRPWEAALAAPVTFGAAENRMEWTLAQMDAALPYGDRALLGLYRAYADRLLTGLHVHVPVSRHAAAWLSRQDLATVRPDDLARALNMSGRSLRRALSEDGTSWRILLDQARHRLALQWVDDGSHTLVEIARRLGYSDVTSLVRAFNRWEGMPPRRYAHTAAAAAGVTARSAAAQDGTSADQLPG